MILNRHHVLHFVDMQTQFQSTMHFWDWTFEYVRKSFKQCYLSYTLYMGPPPTCLSKVAHLEILAKPEEEHGMETTTPCMEIRNLIRVLGPNRRLLGRMYRKTRYKEQILSVQTNTAFCEGIKGNTKPWRPSFFFNNIWCTTTNFIGSPQNYQIQVYLKEYLTTLFRLFLYPPLTKVGYSTPQKFLRPKFRFKKRIECYNVQ